MSTFEVKAYPVTISIHPDPEVHSLSVAKIGGYTSVVRKNTFVDGQLAIYIPEAAVVPLPILNELGLVKNKDGELVGGLAGSKGNRVKAVRLRGQISQGIVWLPTNESQFSELLPLQENVDYADVLGITKWVPPIPTSLAGEVEPNGLVRPYTNLENIKKPEFTGVFDKNEQVVITEKIHGTNAGFFFVDGNFVVSSKGLAGKGLVLKDKVDAHGRNVNTYWRAAHQYGLKAIVEEIASVYDAREVTLFGEIYGPGIQDLTYGQTEIGFRAFDIRIDGTFVDYDTFVQLIEGKVELAPLLYRGPFDIEIVKEHTIGQSTLADHIREGVVIRTEIERNDPASGRAILKSISEDYLTRKGGTEYE